MPDALRLLFYLWLLASIVILARRFFLRVTRKDDLDLTAKEIPTGSDKVERSSRSSSTSTASGGSKASSSPGGPAASGRLRAGRPAGPGVPDRPARALDKPSMAGDGSLVEAVIREEVERKQREERAGQDDAGRGGLFAPLPDDAAGEGGGRASASEPDDSPRPTVAEALAGIALPCDLVPMIVDVADPDPYRAVFVTVGFEANVVGAKLGDELERLGYSLTSSSSTTAVARRDDDLVTVEIHEDAANAHDDGGRLFPTAPGGSVAIEITT